jgi:hypothetical protein
VDETNDGNPAVFPRRDRLWDFAESKSNEKDNGENDENNCHDGSTSGLCSENRTDGIELFFLDGTESCAW